MNLHKMQNPAGQLAGYEEGHLGVNTRGRGWALSGVVMSHVRALQPPDGLRHLWRSLVDLVVAPSEPVLRPGELPPYIETHRWIDPICHTGQAPRPHPYGPEAYRVRVGRRTRIYPSEQAYRATQRDAAMPAQVVVPRGSWLNRYERLPPVNKDPVPPFVDAERWYMGEVRAGRPARLHPYGPGAYTIVISGREMIFPSRQAYQAWHVARNSKPQRRAWAQSWWAFIRLDGLERE